METRRVLFEDDKVEEINEQISKLLTDNLAFKTVVKTSVNDAGLIGQVQYTDEDKTVKMVDFTVLRSLMKFSD